MRTLFRFILGLFGLIGRTLELVGRALFYLFVLLVLGFLAVLLLRPTPEVPRGAALLCIAKARVLGNNRVERVAQGRVMLGEAGEPPLKRRERRVMLG